MVDGWGLFLPHFFSKILPLECAHIIMKVTLGQCHLNSQVVKDLNSIGSKLTLKDLKTYNAIPSEAHSNCGQNNPQDLENGTNDSKMARNGLTYSQ